jgi:hypothetical protein
MTSRQLIAFNNPLFSLFQVTGNTMYREDRLLSTGIFFSTYLTVHAFEHPFSWHASAGFVRSINAVGNAPGVAIPVIEWTDEQKVLAMNEVASMLQGIGERDGSELWHKAQILTISFQAWRRMSADEYLQTTRHRAAVAPACTEFPDAWEPRQRIIRPGH